MNSNEKYPDISKMAQELAIAKLEQMARETEESVINSYSEKYRKNFAEGVILGCTRGFLVVYGYLQKDSIEQIAEDNDITTEEVTEILTKSGMLSA